MYERVNINCAEVNSTRQMGSGIYFFISVSINGTVPVLTTAWKVFTIKRLRIAKIINGNNMEKL
ncbi:hypothetical protein [[Clostridium] symbiosum]|uniref:hypothetical protein n=2 Tax=Clostridium symbiosum TaxID=1512 RepID=UPI0003121E66|nr:hypothetical protein [[Clostridium] symbiosum]